MTIKRFYQRLRRKLAHLLGDRRRVARWSNLMASDTLLKVLRKHFSPESLQAVSIEINTDCNYKCPFCPQSSFVRPVRYITRAGFAHVVEALQHIGFSGSVVLSVNNEPFLHPLLPEFCKMLSDDLPHAVVLLISNGALITEQDIVKLAQIDHPPRVTIDDYTPDHRVIKRMRPWLALPANQRLSVTFHERSWSESISNRAGNQPGCSTRVEDYLDIACAWPFGCLFLNPELKAFLCCSDYRYEMEVGDLNRQSLMDIWRGEALRRVRAAIMVPDRSKVPLCARCDAEWWHWDGAKSGPKCRDD